MRSPERGNTVSGCGADVGTRIRFTSKVLQYYYSMHQVQSRLGSLASIRMTYRGADIYIVHPSQPWFLTALPTPNNVNDYLHSRVPHRVFRGQGQLSHRYLHWRAVLCRLQRHHHRVRVHSTSKVCSSSLIHTTLSVVNPCELIELPCKPTNLLTSPFSNRKGGHFHRRGYSQGR